MKSGGRCITFDESCSRWRCVMVRMSESEQNELWDRWEAGESQRSIARALGRTTRKIPCGRNAREQFDHMSGRRSQPDGEPSPRIEAPYLSTRSTQCRRASSPDSESLLHRKSYGQDAQYLRLLQFDRPSFSSVLVRQLLQQSSDRSESRCAAQVTSQRISAHMACYLPCMMSDMGAVIVGSCA